MGHFLCGVDFLKEFAESRCSVPAFSKPTKVAFFTIILYNSETSIHHRSRTVARKFSIGGLWVCAGELDTQKINKTQLIYGVSCFHLGGWS